MQKPNLQKPDLQALLEQLKTLENSLPKDDTLGLVNQIIGEKYKKFTEETKQDTSLQALESINNKLDKFKQDFDLKPVIDSIEEMRSTIMDMQSSTADKFTKNSQSSDLNRQELTSLIENTKTDLQGMTGKEIADVISKITSLEGQISFSDNSNKEQGQNLKTVIKKIETKLNSFAKNLTDTQTESGKNKEDYKKNNEAIQLQFVAFEKTIKDLKLQFQHRGGGSMPFKVSINGIVSSTRYADINLKAGTNVTITKTDNNTTKQVDITITASDGGSSSFVDNEVVNGSGNTFTLGNTPLIGSEHIFGLGQRLTPGGVDYNISGTGITTINSWSFGQILADYRK